MKSIKPCCQNFKYLNILKEYFKGQYNQYIQEKEQEYKEFIEIGAGFDINDLEQKNFIPIKMMNANRKGHLFCFGTTGSGKSRLIEVMVEQDIKNGQVRKFGCFR
jgi:type IV secretory pathway VirB4 component